MSIEARGKRPYKVWDSGRTVRKGLVVASFTELVERGREKLELGNVRVRVVLECDGTHIDDAEYFSSLPENTVFLFLRQGEHWYPAGVEAIRQAITAIPKIVCETIYSLGLHDEAPVWKVMDQYGKITVVLSWDPCHRGASTLQQASPRKPAGTARVIVSGIGESAIQRGYPDTHTSQAALATTPSISTATGAPQTVVHGTITTILRDGKKETLINDVGTTAIQSTLLNHDPDQKSSTFIGRLSRQGSSVESGHSAVHVHTPECCTRGHPQPVIPARASPTGDKTECDFHCCTLHEDGTRLTSSRGDRHHHHHHHPNDKSQDGQKQQVHPQLQRQVSLPSSSPLLPLSPQTEEMPPSLSAFLQTYSPQRPHTPHSYSPLPAHSQQQQSQTQQHLDPSPQHQKPQHLSVGSTQSLQVPPPHGFQQQQHSTQSLKSPKKSSHHQQQQHYSTKQHKSKQSDLTPEQKHQKELTKQLKQHSEFTHHQKPPKKSNQHKQPQLHSQHSQEQHKYISDLNQQQKQIHLKELQKQLHQQQIELQQIELHQQQQLLQQKPSQDKNKCNIHDHPCNCC